MVNDMFGHINLEGVKGVLIDLDNTLYPYLPNHQRSMEICLIHCEKKYGIPGAQFTDIFKQSRSDVHRDLHGQAASHSRLLYFLKFSESFFGKTNPAFALEMEELYWSEFLSGMMFNPGAEEFLKEMSFRGIGSCLVTDLTTHIQMRKWNVLNLGRYIDFMVSSEEAGIEKPAPGIFEMALKKLKLEAKDVIMLGDSEEKDIKGAEALGIRAYLIR